MEYVSSLTWNTADPTNAVASVPVDFGADVSWRIALTGNIQRQPNSITPVTVTVDNQANDTACYLTMGAYYWRVPPYTRQTFGVPVGATSMQIDGTSGTVTLYFSQQQQLSPDATDMLAIQQKALGVTKFPLIVYASASRNMLTTDFANEIVFAGANPGTYYLLPVATTPVANGQFIFVNNLSAYTLTLTPNGTDTINGNYANLTPLVLQPGDCGYLRSDGAAWYFTWWARPDIVNDEVNVNIAGTNNDVQRTIRFANGAAAQNYNLPAVNSTDNGDRITLWNDSAYACTITPKGGDTINGFWTYSTPLTMGPGDSGYVINDNGSWRYRGELSFESGEIALTKGATGTIAHGFPMTPYAVDLFLRCKTAEAGYSAGDVLKQNASLYTSSGDYYLPNVVEADSANIIYTFQAVSNIGVINKGTGLATELAYSGSAPANWEAFFTARVKL
jgi:hypothetical protein